MKLSRPPFLRSDAHMSRMEVVSPAGRATSLQDCGKACEMLPWSSASACLCGGCHVGQRISKAILLLPPRRATCHVPHRLQPVSDWTAWHTEPPASIAPDEITKLILWTLPSSKAAEQIACPFMRSTARDEMLDLRTRTGKAG